MSADRRRKAFAIFDAVCELPTEERRAAVLERSANDEALRALVERMLAEDAAETTEGAFGTGLGAAHLASALGVERPERIGRYRVIREIGRGGMGVVYEAEQDDPKRRVALKVMRDGFASHEIRRRFRREARLLGQLQHPGIAHVYEAGTEQVGGRELLFFAMELIEGVTLGAHIRASNLGQRDTLELFARICDAVQHAHQKGVIHRDLKPQNVLVKTDQSTVLTSGSISSATMGDSIGQPKILDFGVARTADAGDQVTLQTHAGQIVGTLAYMSPEQLDGDPANLDTRCDVYAIGVMLYQTLAGWLPVEVTGKPVAEAARLVKDTTPRLLGSVDPALRGDVETIVATAMEKDRERRYASAAALAEDIRRHLTNEPIAARPASALYQLKKFTARNKLLVGSAAAFVLLLMTGLVVTSSLLINVERERRASQDAEARTRAVANFQRELLEAMNAAEIGARIESAMLQELHVAQLQQDRTDADMVVDSAQVALAVERVNETNVGRAVLQQILVDGALELVKGRYIDDPRTEAEIRWALLENFIRLGEDAEAAAQARRIVELRTELYGPDAHLTLAARHRLGAALARTGDYEDAEAVLLGVIDAELRLRGDDSSRIVIAQTHLGRVYRETGRFELARETLITALEGARSSESLSQLVFALNELGVLSLAMGETETSIEYFEEYLSVAERTTEPDSRRRLLALNNVMAAKLRDGRLEEAEQHAREAVPLHRREFGDTHHRTMSARNNLARVLLELGEPDEAVSILRSDYERSQRLLDASHAARQAIATNYIEACLATGDAATASSVAQGLLEERRAAQSPRPGSIAQTLEQLGECQLALREFALAEASFRECLELRTSINAEHWLTHRARTHLGVVLARIGRSSEAASLITEGVAGIERAQAGIPPNMRDRELERARARLTSVAQRVGTPADR